MKGFSIELIELIAGFCSSARDKASLCLVNRLFYSTVTRLLYQRIMITDPRRYVMLKDTLSRVKEIRQYVYCLDFSSYTTRGTRWSEAKAKKVLKLNELGTLIQDCDYLKELLIGEEMMYVGVSPAVLHSIFSRNLETLEFISFGDKTVVIPQTSSLYRTLKNVSFFMCTGLSQEHFFMPFFKQLNNKLEKLDMSFTRITSHLFAHLTHTRTLTHLNLQGCYFLTCCSPLISFIERNACTLVELNLNVKHGTFCSHCLYKIVSCLNHHQLKSLDLGGHVSFNDMVLQQLLVEGQPFSQLQYFSIQFITHLSLLHCFLSQLLPRVYYLQLSDNLVVPFIQSNRSLSIQVIEIQHSKKYPKRLLDWQLVTHGKRAFYTKFNVDPKYAYAKKLILLDQLSPMSKYWSYST